MGFADGHGLRSIRAMTECHTIANDVLRAEIAPLGASLVGLWTNAGRNLVLGLSGLEGVEKMPGTAGSIVGPLANRIGNASVTLDGTVWNMTANEGTTALHGGPTGIQKRHWSVTEETRTRLTLAIDLSHGDCGLPGNRKIEAVYELDGPNLILTLTGETDEDTYLNLAHHPYWSLDDRADTSGHELRVMADWMVVVGPDKVPTGAVTTAAGPFHLSKGGLIPPDADHCYCLGGRRFDSPKLAAKLHGSDGTMMSIETTEPGLQVYSGSNLPELAPDACRGKTIQPFAGVALEPQGWPDAPNHPHFPSVRVSKDEPYRQVTRYCFQNI